MGGRMNHSTIKSIMLCITFMVCALGACAPEDIITGPQRWLGVVGTVSDSINGRAIDSAMVVLGDTAASNRVVYTDSSGFFVHTIADSVGLYTITTLKDGYYTYSKTVNVDGGKPYLDTVDFYLMPME